jgi:hypothetical protein
VDAALKWLLFIDHPLLNVAPAALAIKKVAALASKAAKWVMLIP